MKARSILDTVGGTPHIRINKLFGATHNMWINPASGWQRLRATDLRSTS